MNTKSKQETFDLVAVKLVAQGGPSAVGTTCSYRGDDGRRCAAGHLIPDAEFKRNFEGYSLGTQDDLDEVVRGTGHDFDFVRGLQKAHDHAVGAAAYQPAADKDAAWLEAWASRMRKLAVREDLSTTTLDKALAARNTTQETA